MCHHQPKKNGFSRVGAAFSRLFGTNTPESGQVSFLQSDGREERCVRAKRADADDADRDWALRSRYAVRGGGRGAVGGLWGRATKVEWVEVDIADCGLGYTARGRRGGAARMTRARGHAGTRVRRMRGGAKGKGVGGGAECKGMRDGDKDRRKIWEERDETDRGAWRAERWELEA
ncbi:hypothetical protein C8R44DRAFT_741134 [Mycena epipterygia]|nr:hypothetical protein C8R44DRAFT_741134 [Mycena epipterygia]